MEVVTGLTRVKGTVNEVLFARVLAIRELQSRGLRFDGSPTNNQLALQLGLIEEEVGTKKAGRKILEWAANKTHQ